MDAESPPSFERRGRPKVGVRGVVHAATAALLFGLAALTRVWPGAPTVLIAFGEAFLAGGFVVLLAVLLRRPAWLAELSTRLCLATLSFVMATGVAEALFRLVGFDFRRQQALLDRMPPYWRLPRVPTGTVFFRREGGLQWTGQVVRNQLERAGLPADSYTDEPVVTVHYDAWGFRNEPRPDAWDIAVTGDSFTELGAVAFDDLFTTVLARRLNRRVLNLGVAGTGPLSYLSYLQDYGESAATTDFVVVFYEGNDLENLRDERRAERRFAATGQRPFRDLQPQTSLLRALGEWLAEPRRQPEAAGNGADALFQGRDGDIAVTLGLPPPGPEAMEPETVEALESFTTRYAALAGRRGVRAWLAYMPAKPRALREAVRLLPDAAPALRDWQPSELPEVIQAACVAHGIRFVDLTPALAEVARRDHELPYNALVDSHLNACGSRVVGEVLAETLREPTAGR